MFGLKIFVQTFRRVPPVPPPNFCHPDHDHNHYYNHNHNSYFHCRALSCTNIRNDRYLVKL